MVDTESVSVQFQSDVNDGEWTASIISGVTSGQRDVCFWTINNGVDLKRTIHLQLVTDCKDAVEPEDIMTADDCLLFQRTESAGLRADDTDGSPVLPICVKVDLAPMSNFKICSLSSLCDTAKHVELYDGSRGGEYVTTVRANRCVGMPPDEPVYKASIDIRDSLQSIIIKFLIPRTSVAVWLYGVLLRVRRCDTRQSTALTSEAIVESTLLKLERNGISLSDNAKRFATLLAASQKSKSATPTTSALTSLMTKCFFKGVTNNESSKQTTSDENSEEEKLKEPETNLPILITLISSVLRSSLDDLERRLFNRIDARLNLFEEKQTAKLNQLFEIIQQRLPEQSQDLRKSGQND